MQAQSRQGKCRKLGSLEWRAVLRQIATSRALDDLEESTLLPERKVLYQFSARGHELTQVLLGAPADRNRGTEWAPTIDRGRCS